MPAAEVERGDRIRSLVTAPDHEAAVLQGRRWPSLLGSYLTRWPIHILRAAPGQPSGRCVAARAFDDQITIRSIAVTTAVKRSGPVLASGGEPSPEVALGRIC